MATVNAGDPAPAMAATLDDAEGVAHRLDDALAAVRGIVARGAPAE